MRLRTPDPLETYDNKAAEWAKACHQAVAEGRLREDQIIGVPGYMAHAEIMADIRRATGSPRLTKEHYLQAFIRALPNRQTKR